MTRVLMIAGLGRSGSTLLERIVGEATGVCALGEVVHLWERALRDDQLCGCGEPFSTCPFWQAVGERAFQGWENVDTDAVLALKRQVDRTRFVPLLLSPWLTRRHKTLLQEYLELYDRIYTAASEESGSDLVIDSSKHASLAYCLRHSMINRRGDLMIVNMVRDAPGVAHSWARSVVRPEITGRVEMMPRHGALRVGLSWVAYNALVLALSRIGCSVMVVRYEDLLLDAEGVVRSVLGASGHDRDAAQAFVSAEEVLLTPQHTVAGNPMRFRTGLVEIKPDDAWRNDMRLSTRLGLQLLTFPMRCLLGYAAGSRRLCRPSPRRPS